MKRFFLVVTAALFLIATTFAFFPTPVAAASDYDETITYASPLIAKDTSCSAIDLSTFWPEVISASSGTISGTSVTWSWAVTGTSNFNYAAQKAAWDAKERWGVSQTVNPGDGSTPTRSVIQVWSTTNSDVYGVFGNYGSTYQYLQGVDSTNNVVSFNITQTSGSGCNLIIQGNAFGDGATSIADGGSGTAASRQQVFFAYMDSIVYPPGYDGNPVPETPPSEAVVNTPQVGYYTDTENVLHANFIGGSGTTVDGIVPYLRWTVFAPDGTTVLDTKVTDLAVPYEFRLPGNDTYFFEVTYLSPAEASPPGTPFPSLVPFPDGTVIRPVKFTINANGTLTPGSNFLNECEASGGVLVCEVADPLQDCSTFGVDLGGYFQCIFTNFGIWLRNTLIDLFVPSYSFTQPWINNMGTFLNEKLGFVYSSFSFIGGLFGGIIANGATTTCLISAPGTLFDAPFEVDVCKMQEVVGNTVFQLIQGLVISLTILALMFAGYRKYLEVVDHR